MTPRVLSIKDLQELTNAICEELPQSDLRKRILLALIVLEGESSVREWAQLTTDHLQRRQKLLLPIAEAAKDYFIQENQFSSLKTVVSSLGRLRDAVKAWRDYMESP